MDRTFLLPLVSFTALGTTGCGLFGSAIVGDWVGVSIVGSDGAFYNLPVTKSYTYSGVTYNSIFNFMLSAERDGSVVAGSYYEYSSSAGDFDRDTYLQAGEWERESGVFELRFQDTELNMDCTSGSGRLRCELIHGFSRGAVIAFEPADG